MSVIRITDIKDERVKLFVSMTEAQLRNRLEPEKGIFIAESAKVIRTALEKGLVPVSMLMPERHAGGEAADIIAACPDVPVYTASEEILREIAGFNVTRGVLCAMRRPAPLDLEEVCAGELIVICQGIWDASNMGAIIRSAAALGADGLLFASDCSDPLNRRTVRVSMGTVFQLPWAILGGDTADEIRRINEMGFATAAMTLSPDSITLDAFASKQHDRIAIVMGNEGHGLPDDVAYACTHRVKIPMYHGVDSLNVAAACAVAVYTLEARGKKQEAR